MTRQRLAAILLLLALGACAQAPSRAPPPAPPPQAAPAPGLQLWPNRDAIQSVCLNDLAATGARFELIGPGQLANERGCSLNNGVKLLRTSLELSRPVELTCPMALRLVQFEEQTLKPLALKYFNKELRRIDHAGGFVCKRMTGNGARVSEHGHGRAIDIWAFDLRDETRISVERHWRDRGIFGQYLREVARGACEAFQVVLSPSSDAAHAKHLHFDIGAFKRCGI